MKANFGGYTTMSSGILSDIMKIHAMGAMAKTLQALSTAMTAACLIRFLRRRRRAAALCFASRSATCRTLGPPDGGSEGARSVLMVMTSTPCDGP